MHARGQMRLDRPDPRALGRADTGDVATMDTDGFVTIVITSYSIHYTKLYDRVPGNNIKSEANFPFA